MNYDEYGEVINGTDTFTSVANKLMNHKPVLIGWTDGQGSHYDVLFVLGVDKHGTVQGGVDSTDLFVSIMRKGAFGFDPKVLGTHESYYAEKLHVFAPQFAELVEGVKSGLSGSTGM